ncbi:unnamed protein product [Chrysoparadoxa australica]
MSTERQVPARYYARLMEVVRAMDIDTDALVADSDIATEELADPEGTLSLAQIETLLAATRSATGRTDLGLALAAALKLTSHSAVSYGILSSPTAGYALGLVARFFSLILPTFRVRYGCRDNTIRLTLTPAAGMSHACFAFHLELIVACVHRELRDLIAGDMPPYDVHFSIETPPHVARYDALREMRVHFSAMGQPGAEMIWPRDVASRPLALSDPTALRMAESRCADMLERARITEGVAAWGGMMLREAHGPSPGHCELAAALNISSRTLDRYLRKEGTSFRELSKQARKDRAGGLLSQGRLSVTEIAMELGYADAANFSRAFRRDTGLTPSQWRQQPPAAPN